MYAACIIPFAVTAEMLEPVCMWMNPRTIPVAAKSKEQLHAAKALFIMLNTCSLQNSSLNEAVYMHTRGPESHLSSDLKHDVEFTHNSQRTNILNQQKVQAKGYMSVFSVGVNLISVLFYC